jgi:hypothetical protein
MNVETREKSGKSIRPSEKDAYSNLRNDSSDQINVEVMKKET